MLAQGESVEAHALRERGWTISAIARHLGRNRETIRDYLDGKRVPGVRAPGRPDAFGEYAAYCGQRFADDPHVYATVLFDEGLPMRTARISALRQLVLQVPAPVIADALSFHHTTTTRQHANAGATWSRYAGNHDRDQ
jgi:hypothetical protein